MYAIQNLVICFVLFSQASSANNEFDRLPKSPVNYRYFAGEVDQTYKILGSCSEVKATVPMSRCIVKIDHKYKPKYMSISFAEELVGTGIVIFKSTENNVPFVIILTAYHIVVPQLGISFVLFVIIASSTTFMATSLLLTYYSFINYQQIIKIVFGLVLYSIVCSCIIYIFMLMIYPFIFDSSFRITVISNEKTHLNLRSPRIDCQLISSKLSLSNAWKDDIGIIKCTNIETDMFQYFEICQPKLNNNLTIPYSSSINVIGYVGRPPTAFDLIVDPFFTSLSSLMTVNTINGKTPENLLINKKFMNCTGELRLTDDRKLFIDTPSTYGFSGGPCFISTSKNQWEFVGILTGASKLWNTCTALQHSNIFKHYFSEIIKRKKTDNPYNEL
ncbi:unnamed protein product [Rotaria magnacalcarata]|uniref:Peptidase S1 domain-containing protein n=2 Tax=Rotaria magnacalcarata TaxID=392030 RepID=A0A816L6V8_9BILA|nr:unnamed protein product [Rotaria magnacalcarata]